MKTIKTTAPLLALLLLVACNSNGLKYDASGVFEATDVLVSSEASGRILWLDLEEGQELAAGELVGIIDTTQLHLQKLQLISSARALRASRPDITAQMNATREEVHRLKTEKKRIEKLIEGDAATGQQLDEITAQLRVAEAKLAAQMNSLQSSIASINEQSAAIDIQIAQAEDQIAKCRIVNPVAGTVLGKYVEAHEVASQARPLYRIANLETLYLRAYVSAKDLTKIRIAQTAKVFSDWDEEERREYKGRVVWIAEKAEFTPKTVQTKDERTHLVYAVKVAVHNDGWLKIGMYGEVDFGNKPEQAE